ALLYYCPLCNRHGPNIILGQRRKRWRNSAGVICEGGSCPVPREPDLPGVPTERAKWLKFYLSRGWLVFPCCERADSARFKQPLVSHGCSDASNDSESVAAWWRRSPQALVGIRTGPVPAGSGINVLDLDCKHEGQDGIATVIALIGSLPVAPTV